MKRIIICTLAVLLICGCFVGTTIAWLMAETDPVTNTFTAGDINITLEESENLDLKMVPGNAITKDPKVTVKAGSEACWLFIKIDESDNFGNFMEYSVDAGWTPLAGVDGVYYREVEASDADQEFEVLAGNAVTVKTTVTKDMVDGLKDDTNPTLAFKAYAVQKDNVADAATAWGHIPDASK